MIARGQRADFLVDEQLSLAVGERHGAEFSGAVHKADATGDASARACGRGCKLQGGSVADRGRGGDQGQAGAGLLDDEVLHGRTGAGQVWRAEIFHRDGVRAEGEVVQAEHGPAVGQINPAEFSGVIAEDDGAGGQ